MPADDFAVVQAAMPHFQPIYEERIWRPSQPELHKQQQQFQEQLTPLLTPALRHVAKFYDSCLDSKQQFTVELVPIPQDGVRSCSTMACTNSRVHQ